MRKVAYGFVSLDSIPLEPHFRKAKQAGAIEFAEFDEGAFFLGLMAAAHRMPFYPTRAGLGQRHDDDEPVAQDGDARPTTTAKSSWPCPRSTSTWR